MDYELDSPEYRQKFYNALYEAYKKGLKKPLPKDNTIPSIDEYMKKELLAEEFMDKTFEGIHKDGYIRVKEIVKMYRVDPKLSDDWHSIGERMLDIALKEEAMKTDIKNHLILILESQDGVTVRGRTVMGLSEKFHAIVYVLLSEPPSSPEEIVLNYEMDKYYLKSLWLAGFLDV